MKKRDDSPSWGRIIIIAITIILVVTIIMPSQCSAQDSSANLYDYYKSKICWDENSGEGGLGSCWGKGVFPIDENKNTSHQVQLTKEYLHFQATYLYPDSLINLSVIITEAGETSLSGRIIKRFDGSYNIEILTEEERKNFLSEVEKSFFCD